MKYTDDITRLQDAHLDAMLKLAFDLDDAENTQRLLDSPDPELTPDEERLADEILTLALARAKKEKRHFHRYHFANAARKLLPFIINTAACIILLLAIAAPIALANSATFRSKVMQLLVEFDTEKGEAYFSLVQDEEASFDVPEGWRGNHFPSYIPDGFTIYDWDPDFGAAFIEYRDESANQLFFSEYSNGAGVVAGTDGAEMKEIDINGHPGYLIDGIASNGTTHTVNIFWQNETNWFGVVAYGLSADEALQVARSVRRIVK